MLPGSVVLSLCSIFTITLPAFFKTLDVNRNKDSQQVVITTAQGELTIAMLPAVPCRAKSPALMLPSVFTGSSSKQEMLSQVGG